VRWSVIPRKSPGGCDVAVHHNSHSVPVTERHGVIIIVSCAACGVLAYVLATASKPFAAGPVANG
jgi:hypothetical protein